MIRWLKKKLGHHVCEKFSPWERKMRLYSRPTKKTDGMAWLKSEPRVEFTKSYQQRHCLECGKIQQERLEY